MQLRYQAGWAADCFYQNVVLTRRELLGSLPAAVAVETESAPKALYLSFYGVGDAGLRGSALHLLDTTELNAVVIDIKGDRGMICYPSDVALARDCGALRTVTAPNLAGLIRRLHAQNFYTIARQVVFKDHPLASHAREWAARRADGSLFLDREGLAWTDPMHPKARQYNVDIAVEAAELGFDEIQFDYVRFPDTPGVCFQKSNTAANRTEAIAAFLQDAKERLQPLRVAVAADVFGYVLWNADDTGIGQQLETMLPLVDYCCPMLYPSSFQHGIPGIANPLQNPYELILRSLRNAARRTKADPRRFRPWLQAFDDYAFDRRAFGRNEIRSQITAAETFRTHGWMLWNPRNIYRAADLGAKSVATPK